MRPAPEPSDQQLWLVDLVLDVLSPGGPDEEPLVLREGGAELIVAAIGLVVDRGDARVFDELTGLLRLTQVLERGHQSYSAAAAIYRAIQSDLRALEALGVSSPEIMRRRALQTSQFLDTRARRSAPRFGAPSPPGTRKLSTYLATYTKGARR